MNRKASSICSTTRAAAISRAFSSLWTCAWLPAWCGILVLMLSGAWVGVQAQTAHFVRAQGAIANAANNNLASPGADATGDQALDVTSTNGNFGSLKVGHKSPTPISMVFTFDTAATLGSTKVVTLGATGLDFVDARTGTCKAGVSYTAGKSCTVNVSFTPKFAGARYGAANLLDGSGNVLATGYLQGTGVGPQTTFVGPLTIGVPGVQSRVVTADNVGDNADAMAVAVDGSGNVYFCDPWNDLVLKETLSAGSYTQSVIASLDSDGLNNPVGIAVDGGGNVYIADDGNARVLKETPSAGGYTESVVANSASNGLGQLWAVAVDGSGNVYIADFQSSSSTGRVLKETLSAAGYTQSTVANIVSNSPQNLIGIAVDGSGSVYIANGHTVQVLKETPSAGGYTESVVADYRTLPGGYGTLGPSGIAVDGSGDVYLTVGTWDQFSGYDTSEVLKEAPSQGGYTQSIVLDSFLSGIEDPFGIAVDGPGNLYISSSYSASVYREDLADPLSLIFSPTAVGSTSIDSPITVTVSNVGNASLVFPLPQTGENPSVPANFTWDYTSTCEQTTASSSAAFELAAGASCTMAFDFKPVSPPYSGTAELTDNNLNVAGVQGISLAEEGVQFSQTIIFPQPATPVYNGAAPILLSATGGASGNPVIFSIVSGPGSLSGTNNSVLNFTGPGTIVIAANQAGNGDYAAAAQVTRSITVLDLSLAALTAPTPGSELNGPSVTVTWSPGVGPTAYMLYLGSTGVGSNNIYNSGSTTATSANLAGLPINGEKIYARLYSSIGGTWHYLDYVYWAASLATLTSPTPNSTLPGSNVTFTWSAGVDVTLYYLLLGSNGVGSNDLYSSGYTTHRSVNVTGLPTNGETVYARLFSFRAGAWRYYDYTYTAELLVTLTAPAPNSTLPGSSVTFSWSGGVGITKYYLLLGSNGVGSDNLYNSGYTMHKSVNVTGLPTNGETIYARLYWYVNGAWHHADTTYTAE